MWKKWKNREETKGEKLCRICYDSEDDGVNTLISPCLCKGSIENVHIKCLQEWIRHKVTDTCEMCNHKYTNQAIQIYTLLESFCLWAHESLTKIEINEIFLLFLISLLLIVIPKTDSSQANLFTGIMMMIRVLVIIACDWMYLPILTPLQILYWHHWLATALIVIRISLVWMDLGATFPMMIYGYFCSKKMFYTLAAKKLSVIFCFVAIPKIIPYQHPLDLYESFGTTYAMHFISLWNLVLVLHRAKEHFVDWYEWNKRNDIEIDI